MKKLFFAFALLLALFMLGCQEGSITDPVLTGSGDKANTISLAVTSGTIPLEGILKVPGKLNTYYSIKGAVDYAEQVSSSVTTATPSGYDVKVTLSANGTLNDSPLSGQRLEHNLWYFSSDSEDQILVPIDEKYKMEKVYPISGRRDGMVLVCRFYITTNSVQLGGMWLSFLVKDNRSSASTL